MRVRRGGKYPYEYLVIVENRRVRGRHQQRVIGTLGRRDRLVLEDGRKLEQLARSLIRWRERLRGPQPVRRLDLEGEARVTGGRVVGEGCVSYRRPGVAAASGLRRAPG